MSTIGTVIDNISRYNYNNYLRKVTRLRYTRIREVYFEHLNKSALNHLNKNIISKEELEIVKFKIRKKLRKERAIVMIKSMIIVCAILLLLTYLYRIIFFKQV